MKRKLAFVLVLTLIFMFGSSCVMAAKPPKTALDVTILSPQDGVVVENGGTFAVHGTILAKRGDAGLVETYVQYALGETSTDFKDVDGTNLQFVSGNQPQTRTLLKDQSYAVSWTLTGNPGTYEIRIFSQGSTAKSGSSETRTITITGPPLPPGIFCPTNEYRDPEIGFGTSVGSFANTFSEDGVYEVLVEGKNNQGTRKPIDDTTELGWVFEFSSLEQRMETTLYLKGHAEFPVDDTDVAFEVQLDSAVMWETVATIRNTEQDMFYAADIPDDVSDTIRIRVVDNDRTIGNKVASSLYLDCLWISNRTFQCDSSGMEILVAAPDRCIYVWENFRGAWMQEAEIHTEQGICCIEIVDLNSDGIMETLVGEVEGVIEIFENNAGVITRTHRLIHPYLEEPEEPGPPGEGILLWVNDIAVGDLDNDEAPYLELLTTSDMGRYATVWKMGATTYEPIFNITLPAVGVAVEAGDLDDDPELELVVSACIRMPGIVMIYEYQGDGTWAQSANYTGFTEDSSHIDRMEISDVDNDGKDNLVVENYGFLCVLDYVNGELVKKFVWGGRKPDLAVDSFVCGDAIDDTRIEIVAVDYNPYGEDIVIFFETVNDQIVNTFNLSSSIDLSYIALEDIDLDGLNEYVISGGSVLTIWRGDNLCYALDMGQSSMGMVAIGDYDNDSP